MSMISGADFDHVLLTRFNLPSKGYEKVIRAQEGWLRERVDLFERYCLPSVRNQKVRPARWIVYFDPESPSWMREKITTLNADEIFLPLFRSEVVREDLLRDIVLSLPNRKDYLLTTNLDNDDGLANDFSERIRNALTTGPTTAIYFTNGLIRTSKGLYKHKDPSNAFCSVLAPWAEPDTCWADWHNLLGKTMPVLNLAGSPAWLQVVHGGNVSNRVRGIRISPEIYTKKFPGLLDDIPVPTSAQLFKEHVVRRPGRSFSGALRASAKAVILAVAPRESIDNFKVKAATLKDKSRRSDFH